MRSVNSSEGRDMAESNRRPVKAENSGEAALWIGLLGMSSAAFCGCSQHYAASVEWRGCTMYDVRRPNTMYDDFLRLSCWAAHLTSLTTIPHTQMATLAAKPRCSPLPLSSISALSF